MLLFTCIIFAMNRTRLQTIGVLFILIFLLDKHVVHMDGNNQSV